jgi:co-chaperonin GroES (HSP10)
MEGGFRPLGKRILVERTDGHGIEKVLASGIVLPATREAGVQSKSDLFRAKVCAMGDEAKRLVPDLSVGEDVFVYAYSGRSESVYTGDATHAGVFIEPDDICCVVEGD